MGFDIFLYDLVYSCIKFICKNFLERSHKNFSCKNLQSNRYSFVTKSVDVSIYVYVYFITYTFLKEMIIKYAKIILNTYVK